MRRLLPLLVVLGLAALTAAPAMAAPAALGLVKLDGDIGVVSDPGRYSYVVLNAWESSRIPALKAANPGVKVLVYKDMSSTRSYAVRDGKDDALLPTGVGYAGAEQSHPDWFLRDTKGNRLEWVGYDDHWWMDVGSPSYQAAWLASVQDETVRDGWDGVMIDNAMADPQWYLGGRTIAKYPSASSYAAATRSFLAAVGPSLMAKGLVVLPNISDASPDVWADWIHYSSGAMKEHWMKYPGAATFGEWDFNYEQALLDATQAQGKAFLGVTYSTPGDERTMRFARAGFLVGWNGGAGALVYMPGKGIDPWSDDWTSDVGVPAGARVKVGSSGYRRDYTGGTALVNASDKAAQTFELGRSYLTPEGVPVTSITVDPRSGIVLRLPVGVTDPPPTPPPATPTPSVVTPPPAVTLSVLTKPPAAPKANDKPKAKPRKKVKRVSFRTGRVLHGRVHARGTWRVTVYWQHQSHWRLFARTRTNTHGVFRVTKPVRARHAVRMRAVARVGRTWANSKIVRVSAS